MSRRRSPRDPYTLDPKDPVEMIAKVLVGGSYRVPVEGRGSAQRLGASDIAAAVGFMHSPLDQQTVLAVATRAGSREIAKLSLLAYRAVVVSVRALRPPPIDLGQPADRFRLRIAVYDAAAELVWPEHRRPMKDLAKAAKMRLQSYAALHRCATATLQQALNEGRLDFAQRLWAHQVEP